MHSIIYTCKLNGKESSLKLIVLLSAFLYSGKTQGEAIGFSQACVFCNIMRSNDPCPQNFYKENILLDFNLLYSGCYNTIQVVAHDFVFNS